MRQAMNDSRPGSLRIGEHCHDFTLDAQGDGWDGVMNYTGFTWPVWTWLRDSSSAPKVLGSPLMVPRLGGSCVMDTISEFAAMAPWRSIRHSFNLVGSHDTTRIRTPVGRDSRRVDVAAGLLFTMPGIPMMTYGDEVGVRAEYGEDGRRVRCPGAPSGRRLRCLPAMPCNPMMRSNRTAEAGTPGYCRPIGDSSQRVTSAMLCGTGSEMGQCRQRRSGVPARKHRADGVGSL